MAKWVGVIGYADQVEISPGVYVNQITERKYFGELNKVYRRTEQSSQGTISNLNFNNEISIVSDPYANDNLSKMVYVSFGDTKWCITGVTVNRPRILLTIGGVYNGDTPSTSDTFGEYSWN